MVVAVPTETHIVTLAQSARSCQTDGRVPARSFVKICYSDTTMDCTRSLLAALAFATCTTVLLSAQSDAESEARAALDEYFRAWNAADNEAVVDVSNFPRVSFGRNGQVVVREQPSDIEIDFDLLRRSEGWDHTTLDLVEAMQVSPDKVHFRVVSSRRTADGSAYRTVPALYILTNQDGHWGLQLQSILPPTFTLR